MCVLRDSEQLEEAQDEITVEKQMVTKEAPRTENPPVSALGQQGTLHTDFLGTGVDKRAPQNTCPDRVSHPSLPEYPVNILSRRGR